MKSISNFLVFAFVVTLLGTASVYAGVNVPIESFDLGNILQGGAGLVGLGAGTIKMLNLPHLDANESVFFARELEYVKSRSYDKKYAELKARLLIPVSSEAEAWADAIVYESYDQVGAAKLIAGY